MEVILSRGRWVQLLFSSFDQHVVNSVPTAWYSPLSKYRMTIRLSSLRPFCPTAVHMDECFCAACWPEDMHSWWLKLQLSYTWTVWASQIKTQSQDTSTKYTLLPISNILKRKYRHIYETVITDRIVFITSGTRNNENSSKYILFWIKLLYFDSYFTESYH